VGKGTVKGNEGMEMDLDINMGMAGEGIDGMFASNGEGYNMSQAGLLQQQVCYSTESIPSQDS